MEVDYTNLSPEAMQYELNLQKRPPWILRKIVSALENYRVSKKLGWSRKWNKGSIKIFRAHKYNALNETEYISKIKELLNSLELSEIDKSFVDSLIDDEKLMFYVFYHNRENHGEKVEGITISIGRKLLDDKTKRDRIDIVLEDRLEANQVDGTIENGVIYINPFDRYLDDEFTTIDISNNDLAQKLYSYNVEKYNVESKTNETLWDHMFMKFIDNFGAREFIPERTSYN